MKILKSIKYLGLIGFCFSLQASTPQAETSVDSMGSVALYSEATRDTLKATQLAELAELLKNHATEDISSNLVTKKRTFDNEQKKLKDDFVKQQNNARKQVVMSMRGKAPEEIQAALNEFNSKYHADNVAFEVQQRDARVAQSFEKLSQDLACAHLQQLKELYEKHVKEMEAAGFTEAEVPKSNYLQESSLDMFTKPYDQGGCKR